MKIRNARTDLRLPEGCCSHRIWKNRPFLLQVCNVLFDNGRYKMYLKQLLSFKTVYCMYTGNSNIHCPYLSNYGSSGFFVVSYLVHVTSVYGNLGIIANVSDSIFNQRTQESCPSLLIWQMHVCKINYSLQDVQESHYENIRKTSTFLNLFGKMFLVFSAITDHLISLIVCILVTGL